MLENFKDEMKKEIKALFAEHLDRLVSSIKDIETDLNTKTEKLLQLDTSLDKLDSIPDFENLALVTDLEAVKRIARHATVIANDCEQYSRRNNVRIRRLEIPKGNTNFRESVASWINTELALSEVTVDDIAAVHPLPTKNKNNDNTGQTMIVRFNKREVRDGVIKARKILKKSRYSISDDLTSLNIQLITRLKNSEQIVSAWSWQGKIFAKLPCSS